MSIRLMTAAWAVDLPAGEKLLLLALADSANDSDGRCWPGMKSLCKKTGRSERSLQYDLRRLEEAEHITREPVPGKGCFYTVHPQATLPLISAAKPKTPANAAPPQDLHPRKDCTPAETAPVQKSTQTPARVAPKPSRTSSEAKASSQRAAFAPPPDVSKEVWSDYLKLRSRKRAPMTDTAYRRQCALLEKLAAAGHNPDEIVATSVERGWTGLFEPDARRSGAAPQFISKSGYVYRGTLEQIKREAERRNDLDTYWKASTAIKQSESGGRNGDGVQRGLRGQANA